MNKQIVTDNEVIKFDAMVTKVIKNEILKYWGVNTDNKVFKDTVMIGRFGMTFNDLLQYGRMVVFKQIKWFKEHGYVDGTGEVKNAKMTTLIFQQLRNKFMSLSKSYSNSKHGGQIINTEEYRDILQQFMDKFDDGLQIEDNIAALQAAVSETNKDLKDKCSRKFVSNAALLKFLRETILSLDFVSHVNYEVSEAYLPHETVATPETDLLIKSEIASRLLEYKKKNKLESLTLNEYMNHKKESHSAFQTNTKTVVLLQLAQKRGFRSQKDLASHFGLGMTTLSNIIHGRSNGSKKFRDKLEKEFGKTFEELMKVVNKSE